MLFFPEIKILLKFMHVYEHFFLLVAFNGEKIVKQNSPVTLSGKEIFSYRNLDEQYILPFKS